MFEKGKVGMDGGRRRGEGASLVVATHRSVTAWDFEARKLGARTTAALLERRGACGSMVPHRDWLIFAMEDTSVHHAGTALPSAVELGSLVLQPLVECSKLEVELGAVGAGHLVGLFLLMVGGWADQQQVELSRGGGHGGGHGGGGEVGDEGEGGGGRGGERGVSVTFMHGHTHSITRSLLIVSPVVL
jgi:hypothetical protein